MVTPSMTDALVTLIVSSQTTNGHPWPAGEAQRADAVYRAIRERFAADSSPEARAALADFEHHPTRHQEAFRRALDDLLVRDPAFAAQIERLINPPPAPAVAPNHPQPAKTKASPANKTPAKDVTYNGPPPLPAPLAALCDRLMATFNLEELRDLALDLGINPEEIPGTTTPKYSRGLILRCWRDGKLDALTATAARLRPNADWAIPLAGLPATPPAEFDHEESAIQVIIKQLRSFFSDRQLVALVALILALAGAIGLYWWQSNQPDRMTGEFNIAVAEIDLEGDEADKVYAPIITQQITDILSQELDNIDAGVQISDVNMHRVQDEAGARRLAEQVAADVVIWGKAESLPDGDIRFTPHFYVNATKHPNVFEVNGSDFLEQAVKVAKTSLDEEPPDTAAIAARAALVTHFTQALVYLAFDDLASASREIEAAVQRVERDESLAGLEGYEVVHLYASQIARLEGRWDDAEAHIADAFALTDGNYARGHIARANILFDRGDYAAAHAAYLAAMDQDAPPGDLIDAKASLGLGNLALSSLIDISNPNCNAEEQTRRDEAIARYRAVIAAYEAATNPDDRLRQLAGQAWAYTGEVYEICGDRSAAAEAYRAALALPLPEKLAEEIRAHLALLEPEED
jgi:hypothetical protein